MYIQCQGISHFAYSSREEFDDALHQSLEATGVEIVCLTGFIRILSGMGSTLLTVVTSPIYGGSWCGDCVSGRLH
ncbi:hypothetical protein DPMN_119077 [Dreissena polymorpha]|uniref:Uncharacterized protein n=1 Tax=Dreissena polymorpha TaxID=45954 RepID=A0A9D4GI08_DREPO|nr:hypothetical protein DPMN_119077 [Dreissena polymorpha]